MLETERSYRLARLARRWAGRFLVFYGLWLLLSQAQADFLFPGIFAAGVATYASLLIWQAGGRRLNAAALPGYLLHFLWRSFIGGVDVAVRVFHPRLPISPTFLRYRCRAEDENARVLFCDAVSLMPGTLVARLEGKRSLFHLLSSESASEGELEREEIRLARLFSQKAGERP